MQTGLLLGAAMLLTFEVARAGSRTAAAALVVQALLWLHVDAAFEGPRLVRFTEAHGIVAADLVAFAAVAAAAWAWRRAARSASAVPTRRDP
jgi:hypothetical protein